MLGRLHDCLSVYIQFTKNRESRSIANWSFIDLKANHLGTRTPKVLRQYQSDYHGKGRELPQRNTSHSGREAVFLLCEMNNNQHTAAYRRTKNDPR